MGPYKTTHSALTAFRTLRSVSPATTAHRAPTTPQSIPARQEPSIQEPVSSRTANARHVLQGSTVRLLDCRHQLAVVRRDISVSRGHRPPHPLTELQEIYVLWDHIVRQAPTTQHRALPGLTDQWKVNIVKEFENYT